MLSVNLTVIRGATPKILAISSASAILATFAGARPSLIDWTTVFCIGHDGDCFDTNYDDSDYDELDDNYYHDYENDEDSNDHRIRINRIMRVITMRIMILMMTIEKTNMMVMMIIVSDHLPSPREFLPTRTERIFRNVWFPRSSSPW